MKKTCFELRAALEDVGLSQRQLGRLCGVAEVQVWRWCEGKVEAPGYVWTILTLIKGFSAEDVKSGYIHEWRVMRHHVFRRGLGFNQLAHKWHPDITKRDTTAEMQVLLSLRREA